MSLNSSQFTQTTTVKVFIKPTGATAFIDVGRATEPKLAEDISTVDVEEPLKGINVVTEERITKLKAAYEATISEFTPENLQIVHLADPGTDTTTTSGSGLTVAITGAKYRRAYFMAGHNVTNVQVTEGAIPRTEGVDYKLDAGAGYIEIIPGGAIAEGVNLLVTYNRPAETRTKYIRFSQVQQDGDVRFEYYDGFNEEPLQIVTFKGSYRASEVSGGSTSQLETFKLRILARDTVTIDQRKIQ